VRQFTEAKSMLNLLFRSMRREGTRYNIRSNHSIKYCFTCTQNAHVDKNHPIKKHIHSYAPAFVDVVVIGRFTKKPLFTCRHSQGCAMCSHSFSPRDKSVKKTKGAKKASNKDFNNFKYHTDISSF
jgi:hypothetical protein